mgnify:CR=1 FL=1
MSDVKSCLLVGVGGQGAILISKIMSNGFMKAGYDVKQSEVHGMAQRGGSVSTQVRWGSKVYGPVFGRGEADIMVALEKMEAVRYAEFLNPNGVAVIVEALTDNRQRTAPEVRHAFDKCNGNLGAQGCVSWSFDRKGVIVIDNEDQELDEDTVMMDALEAGAADFEADGMVMEVRCEPDDFNTVVKALEDKGYTFLSADIAMVPQNYISLTDEGDLKNMQKLIDMLEDNDDVQNVWHNWEND